MQIIKWTNTELSGNNIYIRDDRRIVVWEDVNWKPVYINIDCESWWFDIERFYTDLDWLSRIQPMWRPQRFSTYKSNNFDEYIKIKSNNIKRKKRLKQYIRSEIQSLQSILKGI